MQLPRLFRTNVFRLTLAYMALFAVSVGALSAFIYWATLGYLDTQTNAIIEAEINGLYETYERSGLRGLGDVINERVERDGEDRSYYLLANASGQRSPATCRRGHAESTTRAVSGSISCSPTARFPYGRCCYPSAWASACWSAATFASSRRFAKCCAVRRSTASR